MTNDVNSDFRKKMFLSFIKIKYLETKSKLIKAKEQLEEAIKNGTGNDIYKCAYKVVQAEEKYKMAIMCYQQIRREGA